MPSLVAAVLAIGIVRGATRALGLILLTGVVAGTVGAIAVGVVLLRLAVG